MLFKIFYIGGSLHDTVSTFSNEDGEGIPFPKLIRVESRDKLLNIDVIEEYLVTKVEDSSFFYYAECMTKRNLINRGKLGVNPLPGNLRTPLHDNQYDI